MEDIKLCPFCNSGINIMNYTKNELEETYDINCPQCGKYTTSEEMIVDKYFENITKDNLAKLSATIRHHTDNGLSKPLIVSKTLDAFLNESLVPAAQV
jgi:hypothetical protein